MPTNKDKRLEAQAFWCEQLKSGGLTSLRCMCGASSDTILATEDRLGVKVKTVCCQQCGAVRSLTALNAKGAEALYGSGLYRQLFDESHLRTGEEQCDFDRRKGEWLAAHIDTSPACLAPSMKFYGTMVNNFTAVEVGAGTGYTVDWMFQHPHVNTLAVDLLVADDEMVSEIPDSMHHNIDCLLSVHVLEHFADPVATLREWSSHLTDTGRIVCVVPDLFEAHHNVSVKAAGDFNEWWHFPHAWNWTAQTVRLPFELAGLEIERVQFAGPGTLASVGSLVVTAKAVDTHDRVLHYLREQA